MVRFVVMFCLALSFAGAAEATRDFTGVYSIVSPEGPMTLSLQQAADRTVEGTLVIHRANATFHVSGNAVVDAGGEWSVEGTLASATGSGEFDFSADDEDGNYFLMIIPNDASGVPRLDLATSYIAEPGVASSAGDVSSDTNEGTQMPPTDGAHDARLVGLWSTQVIMNTPNGGMTTQLFMEIRSDGILIDLGSRAIGGTPDVHIDTGVSGGGEAALWQTQGNILQASYGGSAWVTLAQFEVSGNRLLLVYYDGDRKLWYRQ